MTWRTLVSAPGTVPVLVFAGIVEGDARRALEANARAGLVVELRSPFGNRETVDLTKMASASEDAATKSKPPVAERVLADTASGGPRAA